MSKATTGNENMISIFEVIHCFESIECDDYGDWTTDEEEVVARFATKEEADAFAKRFSNPHKRIVNVFSVIYNLECGKLEVREIQIFKKSEEVELEGAWWMD